MCVCRCVFNTCFAQNVFILYIVSLVRFLRYQSRSSLKKEMKTTKKTKNSIVSKQIHTQTKLTTQPTHILKHTYSFPVRVYVCVYVQCFAPKTKKKGLVVEHVFLRIRFSSCCLFRWFGGTVIYDLIVVLAGGCCWDDRGSRRRPS